MLLLSYYSPLCFCWVCSRSLCVFLVSHFNLNYSCSCNSKFSSSFSFKFKSNSSFSFNFNFNFNFKFIFKFIFNFNFNFLSSLQCESQGRLKSCEVVPASCSKLPSTFLPPSQAGLPILATVLQLFKVASSNHTLKLCRKSRYV